MSRRELWWLPLAVTAAAAVLLPGGGGKRFASSSARAKCEGVGDNDVISYFLDANGTILVRTQATDVEWGTPKLQADVVPTFRGMLQHWESLIDEASADYSVPPSNIAGIMWAESNGNPALASKKGAIGLMQIMPFHFTPAELPKAFDPRTNIRKGASILAGVRAGFRDLVQMASVYNAGGPQGMTGGPFTNEAWLAKHGNPCLTSRWGYASEPGYIDRVVAANNTYLALQKGQA